MELSDIKANPSNPRLIRDDKFKKLVKSIKEFPKMMELRPMVINADNIVLGGNMRLKALKELGYKDIPDEWVKRAEDLTEEEQRQFIIKDNVGFGEHNWEMLQAEWDVEELSEWGLDMPVFDIDEYKDEIDVNDLFSIDIPFYTPSEKIPNVSELADLEKTNMLINKIELLEIDEDLKTILKNRASFFTDFDFQKIADFYSKQNDEVKEVFEDLGMVILAPKEALKRGFVEISENILKL